MDSSTSEMLPPVITAEESTPQRPQILEGLGSRVIVLTRFAAKKARKLPIVGIAIGYVEDTLSPWLDPVIAHVEKDGLYLLSLADSKIHTVSDVVMARVPLTAEVIPQLQTLLSGQPLDTMLMALDRLRTRGLVGSTADMWAEYEPIVKHQSQTMYSLANRVPGLNVVVFILHDISSPLVSLASDWLVNHSEIKDKHEILLLREIPSSVDSPAAFHRQEGDSDLQLSRDGSSTEPVDSTEVAENSSREIYAGAVKDEEPFTLTDADVKGKFPEMTVVQEDHEEHDELTDLFDTWGMGVKAINPRGRKSLRTLSLQEGTKSTIPPGRTFSSPTRSFRS